jgi:hypothetical protein
VERIGRVSISASGLSQTDDLSGLNAYLWGVPDMKSE